MKTESPAERNAYVSDHQHGFCDIACKLAIPFVDDWQFAIPFQFPFLEGLGGHKFGANSPA